MITFHIDSPDKLNSSSLASIPITSATLPRPAAKVAGKFRIEMKMDFFKAAHDSEVGAGLVALVRLLAGRLVILSIVLFCACLVPLAVRPRPWLPLC